MIQVRMTMCECIDSLLDSFVRDGVDGVVLLGVICTQKGNNVLVIYFTIYYLFWPCISYESYKAE